ncbi:hypothetical protein ACIBVL_12045 [Streptomyces sp. NPDC049687]|uniref:hypothetical protein n=1 Tax=Streptomyces sp. NPDC049687 TaxID=3365596 RepID=UPI003794746F
MPEAAKQGDGGRVGGTRARARAAPETPPRERGIDLLTPVWHLLDLTPHGRADWYPALDYT